MIQLPLGDKAFNFLRRLRNNGIAFAVRMVRDASTRSHEKAATKVPFFTIFNFPSQVTTIHIFQRTGLSLVYKVLFIPQGLSIIWARGVILHVLLHCILGPSSQHEPLYIYCMHKDLYDLFAIVFITCYKIGATYLTTGVLSEASGDKLEEKINTSILDNSTVSWSYSHFLL